MSLTVNYVEVGLYWSLEISAFFLLVVTCKLTLLVLEISFFNLSFPLALCGVWLLWLISSHKFPWLLLAACESWADVFRASI